MDVDSEEEIDIRTRPKKQPKAQADNQSDDDDQSVVFVGESRRFTKEEDHKILNYIVKNSAFDRIGGKSLWEEMAKKFDHNRTHESLKNRFRATILSKIENYCDELDFSSDNVERFQEIKQKSFPKHLISSGKLTRRPYTAKEDEIILDFVFNVQNPTRRQMTISGVLYWQIVAVRLGEMHQMERTWQSLKSRFRIALLPTLHEESTKPKFHSSKHKKIARMAYDAFGKTHSPTTYARQFNARCDKNRAALDLNEDEDDDSDDDLDSPPPDFFAEYKQKVNQLHTPKKEEFSDDSLDPVFVKKEKDSTVRKVVEKSTEKVKKSADKSSEKVKKSAEKSLEKVKRSEPLLTPLKRALRSQQNDSGLPLEAPPSLKVPKLLISVQKDSSSETKENSTFVVEPLSQTTAPTPTCDLPQKSHNSTIKPTKTPAKPPSVIILDDDDDDPVDVPVVEKKVPTKPLRERVAVYIGSTSDDDSSDESDCQIPQSKRDKKLTKSKPTSTKLPLPKKSSEKLPSPKGIPFLPSPNIKDLMRLYRLDGDKQELIKQKPADLSDLNEKVQEKALISRILQPSVRSRVAPKSNRRFIQ